MNKIALVTGGTRGIGKAIALALKSAGYIVGVTYQQCHDSAEKFKQETGIETFCWDVGNYDECIENIQKVCETLGGAIDILVNNAGITRDCMLHKMDKEKWDVVIRANLSSVFNMCSAVIGEMRQKKYGRIINISSINGIKGQLGQVNYSSAKAGVIGFTKALAYESASLGITVNAIAPGYIETDMTSSMREDIRDNIAKNIPLGRFGCVNEVANTVLFLTGENSSFITGTTIHVNGGQYMA